MSDSNTGCDTQERFFLALFLVGGVHHNVVLGNVHPSEYLEGEIRRGMTRIVHMGHSEITERQFEMISNAFYSTDTPLHMIVEDGRGRARR